MLKLYTLLWAWMTMQAGAVEVGERWTFGGLKHIQTGELNPQQLEGKVTLINFWATWCEACKIELVEMEKLLAPQFANPDLNVVFLSLDKDPSKAIAWFKANLGKSEQMLPRLYSDPKFELADRLGVDSFPLTLVIDRTGKISYLQRGFTPGQGSTEKLLAHLQAVLATIGRKKKSRG